MYGRELRLDSAVHERVLVLVRGAREGALTRSLLAGDGLAATVCRDATELAARIEEGAGAALIAEETFTPGGTAQLRDVLDRQPLWSDFPFVVFGALVSGDDVRKDAARLGNVTFLDRPVHVRSMLASVHAAIRSRRRQYDARRAIESRDAFLAMLGHELRNPLGAIAFASNVLAGGLPERERPKELAIIERQSAHLARLVDDLLDVARVTAGKVTLKRSGMNLVDAVRGAFDSLEPRARARGLRYSLQVGDATSCVDGDRQRLEQVFTNLIGNAIKYTPRGGSVTVTLCADRSAIVVTVTDTGVGLAADVCEQIFDPFAQVDTSLDRAQGGLGLGLALVRSIVQLHGGTVRATSPGLGCGSEFHVRLNRAEAPAVRASDDHAAPEVPPRRVVVVEDSDDIRELLVEILRRSGHEVTCAGDGPDGLDMLLSLAPDVAFIDIGLPGFDGLELARRARASGSKARLVALSGYGQTEDKERATEAGFDDHLVKPAGEPEIRRAIRRAG